MRSHAELGKVTVMNFVSRQIVMIEFFRMIFDINQVIHALRYRYKPMSEIRHADITIKQIRRKKNRFPYRCSNLVSLLNGLLIAHRAKQPSSI